MSLLDKVLNQIIPSDLYTDPFKHITFGQIFPSDFYEALIKALPETKYYENLLHPDAMLPDGTSARYRFLLTQENVASLPEPNPILQEVVETFRCPILHEALRKKLRVNRRECIPEVMLYRDLTGYAISPHTDGKKIITMQLYLPPDDKLVEYGTEFYVKNGEAFDTVKKMPFLPNSGYAFAVETDTEPKSWHGVSQLRKEAIVRDTMLLIYYRPGTNINKSAVAPNAKK